MEDKTIGILGVCSVTGNIISFDMCKKCMNKKLWEGEEITLLTKNGLEKPKKHTCFFVPLMDIPIKKKVELISKFKEKVIKYADKQNNA